MAAQVNPSHRLSTTLISLTSVQSALWHLDLPVVDARTVANHKKRARLGMLCRTIRWPILGMAVLVAFECLGRSWSRVALVTVAAALLATLFGWLVNASDLQWNSMSFSEYSSLYAVPLQVSAMVDALLSGGVPQEQIRVEYLKNDPILFIEDNEQYPVVRHDLMIW